MWCWVGVKCVCWHGLLAPWEDSPQAHGQMAAQEVAMTGVRWGRGLVGRTEEPTQLICNHDNTCDEDIASRWRPWQCDGKEGGGWVANKKRWTHWYVFGNCIFAIGEPSMCTGLPLSRPPPPKPPPSSTSNPALLKACCSINAISRHIVLMRTNVIHL